MVLVRDRGSFAFKNDTLVYTRLIMVYVLSKKAVASFSRSFGKLLQALIVE